MVENCRYNRLRQHFVLFIYHLLFTQVLHSCRKWYWINRESGVHKTEILTSCFFWFFFLLFYLLMWQCTLSSSFFLVDLSERFISINFFKLSLLSIAIVGYLLHATAGGRLSQTSGIDSRHLWSSRELLGRGKRVGLVTCPHPLLLPNLHAPKCYFQNFFITYFFRNINLV